MRDTAEAVDGPLRGIDEPATGALIGRRGYLDWLRGVAVLIMIGSHTLDSWTRVEDRTRPEYAWSTIVAGIGAPGFLFLAGIALALAAGARVARGSTPAEAAARAKRRAWQIFGLAFLFRLQSWAISGGTFTGSVLKVDILNIMGLSLLAAAVLWGLGRDRPSKAALLAAAAVATAMVTPLVRAAGTFAPLPDPLESYLRPTAGQSAFSLFPWSGFVLAGAALGVWLESARTAPVERRVNVALAPAGLAVAAGGYWAATQPALYADSDFWTSSPTFFFVRLGILIAALPVAYGWMAAWRGRSPLQQFGMASLLVYWIHVEMVYGVVSLPLHRRLPFEYALAAFAVFSLFLYVLVGLLPRVLPDTAVALLRRNGFLPRSQ